jgi:hypothetical protein
MARVLRFFGVWCAFSKFTLGWTTTTTTASTSSGATIPTPVPGRPSFEIDVVFPQENTTYNYTDYLPVVFAFQNMDATFALGQSYFTWAIMPYGPEEDWRPSGGWVEEQDYMFPTGSNNVSEFVNPDGSPYYLVNSTNTSNWDHPPISVGEKYLYSLQWYLQWSAIVANDTCGHEREIGNLRGNMFFTLYRNQSQGFYSSSNISYPNPQELGNVTDKCALFGGMREIDVNSTDLCTKGREVSARDPCAVKPDAAMVSSMSSVAALRAQPTPTETYEPSPLSSNAARATSMPARSALVLAGIIGGLALPI